MSSDGGGYKFLLLENVIQKALSSGYRVYCADVEKQARI